MFLNRVVRINLRKIAQIYELISKKGNLIKSISAKRGNATG